MCKREIKKCNSAKNSAGEDIKVHPTKEEREAALRLIGVKRKKKEDENK